MKINRIILVFLIVLFSPYWGLKLSLKSSFVTNYVISYIEEVIPEKEGISLSADSIEISFIFLETTLKNLSVEKDNQKVISNSDLSLGFSLRDLLKRNLSIGEMSLRGGELKADPFLGKKNNSNKKINLEKIINTLPFRNLIIDHLNFESERAGIFLSVNDLLIKKGRKGKVEYELELNSSKFKSYEIDTASISGSVFGNKIMVQGQLLKGVSQLKFERIEFDLRRLMGSGKYEFMILTNDFVGNMKSLSFGSHMEIFGSGEFSYKNNDLKSLKLDLEIESPSKKYLNLKKIKTSLELFNSNLVLKKLSVFNFGSGVANLNGKATYDLKNEKLIDGITLEFKDFLIDTNEMFFKKLKIIPLSGKLDGDLVLTQKDDLELGLKSLNLKSLRLGGSSEILSLRDFVFEGPIEIKSGEGAFFNLNAKSKSSSLQIRGDISEKGLNISSSNALINLSEFGHFSGVEVRGISQGDLKFEHNKQVSSLTFDLKGQDLLVSNYFIGDGQGKLIVDFLNDKLSVKDLKTDIKSSILDLNATFDLFSRGEFKIRGTSKNLNSLAIKTILKQNFKEIVSGGEKLDFRGHSSFLVKGDYAGKFNVGVRLKGNYFKYGSELFENFELNTKIDENEFSLEPLVLKKGGSSIYTSGNFKFSENNLELRVSGEDLQIENLEFIKEYFPDTKGNLGLKIEHSGSFAKGNGLFEVQLNNFGNSKFRYNKNTLRVSKKGGLFDISGSFFDRQIKLGSFLDLTSKSKSSVDLKVNMPRLSDVLSLYQPNLIEGKDINSQVSFTLASDFFMNKFTALNLNLGVSDLFIQRKKTSLYIQYPFNEIVISNGKIEKSTLKLFGGEHYLSFFIEGKKIKKAKVFLESHLNADVFELLIPSKLGVTFTGDVFAFGNLNYIDQFFVNYNLDIKESIVSSMLLNRSLSGLNLSVAGDKNSLVLENASADFGGGSINLSGVGFFGDKKRALDFDVDLFDITSNFLEKSNANFDFRGTVSGEKAPYEFSGILKLKKVNLMESVNDWISLFGGNRSQGQSKLIFKNNFVIETQEPIRIKNNLMDIKIDSRLKLIGNNLKPQIYGDLEVVPQASKVFLKGNMFSVTDGAVRLRKSSNKPDPYFDINAETKIDNYNLKSSIVGDLKNLNISFLSDPPLAQEDIFSLLAIGVTLKKTRNLGANAINNVTSLGLGSFLLDQTGINNSLDETLGVKVSIAPEIINDETSLLEGKVNQGVGEAQTRVRSATKIRLTKRISNSLDMSYSSTLGGSLDQRQEMNLNLKVDKNIMIQGVYQTQSSDNSENTDTTNSLGLDLIWKKTFK
tara:strand:- start:3086 stop:7012 length:3927 start_codon:yes stop_codon:yes gene_type:complete